MTEDEELRAVAEKLREFRWKLDLDDAAAQSLAEIVLRASQEAQDGRKGAGSNLDTQEAETGLSDAP